MMNYPGNQTSFYAFWAINGPLNQRRLRRQLDQFCAAGLNGVVWHPRFYPGQPPYLGERYLAELSDVILHAKSIGLTFWIYDEDGWPSGTVGGQLLVKYPEDVQRWAELVLKRPERCLAEFGHGGKKWFLGERLGQGVDYFKPGLARHFLQLTHERYRTGLKAEAWQHVEAFFCDEPEFGLGHAHGSLSRHGAIPWTPRLPELFRQRHGVDLLPLVPLIFFPGPGAAEVRVKFWELLTDIFNESFTAPINAWCSRYGKLFTAHVKGEEHPLFQVPTCGSCHQFFRHLTLPAIDALERFPANNFYPRQVSSAARQFGTGRCMVEAFGGAGWGATPEDLERYLIWLGRNGLTDFVLHLSQYRLDSAAMHDWPPSQPLHLTWREAYPEVLRRVRSDLAAHPRPSAGTLVIAPSRGLMAKYTPQEFLKTNVHNAATYPRSAAGRINRIFLEKVEKLHRAGVGYDLADERTFEQFGGRTGNDLRLGHCKYQHVILAEGCELTAGARTLAESFAGSAPVSRPPDIQTRPNQAIAAADNTLAVRWTLEKHPLNLLLLECVAQKDGWFEARFACGQKLHDAKLDLVFADDLAGAELNGRKLVICRGEEGSTAAVGSVLVQPANRLRFRTANSSVERPFVWLRGLFRVASDAPYVAGPGQVTTTAGPFRLFPARSSVGPDLVADGFPFLREPIGLLGRLKLPAAAWLRLDGVEADAARFRVGKLDLGWSWRTAGEVRFQVDLPAATHRFRLELVPNTFNAFGPHNYYGGDWHIISPGQIKGVRNFADPVDAPVNTHVKAWHFRKFMLPTRISTGS